MPTKETILKEFFNLKHSAAPLRLEFQSQSGGKCTLELINKDILGSEYISDVALLAKWREENSHAFPAQFKVTVDGTKIWCDKALINNPERMLFWVVDSKKKKIGHVGLFRVSESGNHIEADNIVRGEISKADSKIMFQAMNCMLKWQREFLKIPESYLRVFSDNPKAIKLYEDLGYTEIQRTPLRKIVTQDRTTWEEISNSPYEKAEKYFVTMHQRNQ